MKNLNPKEFEALLNQTKDAVLLDVRSPKELEKYGVVDNVLFIDYLSTDFPSKVKTLDRNKTYFVFCQLGKKSPKACAFMANNGFEKLVNLATGLNEWRQNSSERG